MISDHPVHTQMGIDISVWHVSSVPSMHVSIHFDVAFLYNKASVGGGLWTNGFIFMCWGRKVSIPHSVMYFGAFAI